MTSDEALKVQMRNLLSVSGMSYVGLLSILFSNLSIMLEFTIYSVAKSFVAKHVQLSVVSRYQLGNLVGGHYHSQVGPL